MISVAVQISIFVIKIFTLLWFLIFVIYLVNLGDTPRLEKYLPTYLSSFMFSLKFFIHLELILCKFTLAVGVWALQMISTHMHSSLNRKIL